MAGPDAAQVKFRSLFHGCAPAVSDASLESGLFLVRIEAAWARCWDRMTSGRRPAPDVPPVNWASELVVVLALGWRPTSGYWVTIEQVTVRDGQVLVSASENRPGGYTLQAITYPVHAVAVPVRTVGDDLHLIQRITTSTK